MFAASPSVTMLPVDLSVDLSNPLRTSACAYTSAPVTYCQMNANAQNRSVNDLTGQRASCRQSKMHRSLHSIQPQNQHVSLPHKFVCPKVKASRDPLRPWIVRAASDDDGPGNRIKSTLQSLDGLLAPPDIRTTETVEAAKPDSVPEPSKQEESGPGWNVKKIPQPDGTFRVVTSYDLPLAQPRVSYALLLLVLAIYGAGVAIAVLDSGAASNDFFLKLALMKPKVIDGEYYRLLTAVFLHAGTLHLGLNSLALYNIAPQAEAVLGPYLFLAVYLLSGISGNVASFALNDLVVVGASGAIFGLIGALAGYFLKNRQLSNSKASLTEILALSSFNLFLGLIPNSSVDNAGHVGGFLAGLILGLVCAPKFVVGEEPKAEPAKFQFKSADSKERTRVLNAIPQVQRVSGVVFYSVSLALSFVALLAGKQ